MGLLDRIEGRGSSTNGLYPQDPGLIDWLGGGINTTAGQIVNKDAAMRLSAVYACVRVLGETLASTPITLYKRVSNGGREKAVDHRLYNVVSKKPNRFQTKFSFFELGMYRLNLEGVSYNRIVVMPNGKVQLIPLPTYQVTPTLTPDYELRYVYVDQFGKTQVLLEDEVLRVMFMSDDGIRPMSVIKSQKESIGAGLSAQEYSNRFFANDATPRAYIQMPGRFKDKEQKQQFRKDWKETNGGVNRGDMAILEGGLELKSIQLSNEDSQFLESRHYNRSEIAGVFRVPPHMIGDLERSTNNNIEHQSLEFVTYTMAPWFNRWEQSLSQTLLTELEQETYYFEFNVDGLLRGDSAARSQFYKDAIYAGWMSRNEVREKENLNHAEGLDEFIAPVNMTPADQLGQTNQQSNQGNGNGD